MSDRAHAIQRLVELTSQPAGYFEHLMDYTYEESLDLELYIHHALKDSKISQQQANIIFLELMTGDSTERCRQMMAGFSDVNAALISALEMGLISEEQASAGRLAVVTGLTSTEARKFLTQTSPAFSHGQAIRYLQDAHRIDEVRARYARLRLATNITEATASRLLNDNTVRGDIVKAIDLAYNNGELTHQNHVMAHLVHRFSRTEAQAEAIGRRSEVKWELSKAIIEAKIQIVMEQAVVDRKDAFRYLDNTKGDIKQALQLVNDALSQKLVFDGENGDTRYPPNVTAETHIVAVLGVADGAKGLASPREDGWMVSDFYLWKHVLKAMGATQQWLTCEPPAALLAKYGTVDRKVQAADGEQRQVSWKEGYVHGDPFEKRRVVLNKDLLGDAQERLTVTAPGTALRDEFLRRVEDTCRRAEALDQPVLIMTFSHGDIVVPELGGLVIGIDPDNKRSDDFLNPSMLIDIYAKFPKLRLSMFMASCHSGHWVITPRFMVRRPTIMAGAHPNEETFAWAAGVSQRHAGGVYTSAFLAELLKEPPQLPQGTDPAKVRTYEDMSRDIFAEANRLCIPPRRLNMGLVFGSLPLFTTDGKDDWFYQRSNLRLHPYKLNFDRLPTLPASDPHPYFDKKHDYQPNDPVVKQWEARHPAAVDPTHSDRTAGYGTTQRGIRSSTRMLAARYMSSFPGDDSQAKNIHLHNKIRDFFAGFLDRNVREIENLRSQLLYRLWMMAKANEYATGLNLNKLPPIHQWDGTVPNIEFAREVQSQNFDVILAAKIFQRPDAADGENWGHVYLRPMQYLAFAFAASEYGPEDVERLLGIMALRQKAATKRSVKTLLGSKRLAGSIRELKELVGQKSPKKRQRKSLSDIGWMPGSSSQMQR
ncbi:MAG: hypothetical protein Q9177_005621 [Variospora cf. flavescens]